jgi:RimJ/RimL family protein N-acetyltransferase
MEEAKFTRWGKPGWMALLKGKRVNLSIIEKSDLPLLKEWYNDLEVAGAYERITQNRLGDIEKWYDDSVAKNGQWFFIEKKDGTKVGHITQSQTGGQMGVRIGYVVIPKEQRKGYANDAVQVMVDYLFLSKSIVRIQAETDPDNKASNKVLIKAGFKKEGVMRKAFLYRGDWRDAMLYSILREEWKEPKILL